MAIDYVVSLDCALKRRLGVRGLVEHLKQCMVRDLAVLYAGMAYGERLAAVGALSVGSRPASLAARRVPPRDDTLDDFREECARCDANVFAGREWGVGGCVGFVSLPIEASCEEFLTEFAQEALAQRQAGPAPIWLDGLLACRDRDEDDWSRALPGQEEASAEYLEMPEPLELTVAPALGGGILLSDAIWTYLFRIPNERPEQGVAVAQFCSDFSTYLGGSLPWARLQLMLRDSRSIEDLLEYAGALAHAGEIGLPVRVSL